MKISDIAERILLYRYAVDLQCLPGSYATDGDGEFRFIARLFGCKPEEVKTAHEELFAKGLPVCVVTPSPPPNLES